MQSLYSKFTWIGRWASVNIRVCLEEMDAALTKWGDAQDKIAALATLTMEMADAEEEEPTLFDSVD